MSKSDTAVIMSLARMISARSLLNGLDETLLRSFTLSRPRRSTASTWRISGTRTRTTHCDVIGMPKYQEPEQKGIM